MGASSVNSPRVISGHSNFLLNLFLESFYKTKGSMGRTQDQIQEAKKIYPEEITLREFVKANINKLLPSDRSEDKFHAVTVAEINIVSKINSTLL